MSKTSVYRLYDIDGGLLYVGVSKHPRFRLDQHTTKPWWGEVDAIETVEYPTRAAAMKAESLAIRTERPVHNIAQCGGGSVDDMRTELQQAGDQLAKWTAKRDRLIREAVEAGGSLREVGEAVGLSHTAVKFIAHGRPKK